MGKAADAVIAALEEEKGEERLACDVEVGAVLEKKNLLASPKK